MKALKEVVVGGTIYAAGAELPPLTERQYNNCILGGVIVPESAAENVESVKPENDVKPKRTRKAK